MSRIPLRAMRLLPLIGSPVDGEALAACRALKRALAAVGLDLNDMAAAIATAPQTSPGWSPTPYSCFDLARGLRDADGGRLSARERQFVLEMCGLGNRQPSPRQATWLADLHAKLFPRRAA